MPIKQHGLHGLLHAATLIEALAREQLAAVDILPRQAQVLAAINAMGAASQVELAQAFGVSPASMSTMTDRLLGLGLISRSVDPKLRQRNVLALTAKGQDKLEGIHAAWAAVDARIALALGADAATFFAITRRLRAALGGQVPGLRREHNSISTSGASPAEPPT